MRIFIICLFVFVGNLPPYTKASADEAVIKIIVDSCLDESADNNGKFHIRDFLGLACMISDGNAPMGAFPNQTSGNALKGCGLSKFRCDSFARQVLQRKGGDLFKEFVKNGRVANSQKLKNIGVDSANAAYGN